MGNWVYYKEEQPINLDNIISISICASGRSIFFNFSKNSFIWNFPDNNTRDLVFEALKSKMVDVGLLFALKNPKDKLNDCQHDWIRLADIDGSQQVKCKKCGYKKAISVGF